MKTNPVRKTNPRRGIAIGIVLMLGLIILVLGFAMIANSGHLLRHTVDAKQRIKSRYAAEAMVALQAAAVMEKADQVFGSDLGLSDIPAMDVVPGEEGRAKVEFVTMGNKSNPVQELITSGQFKGLKGLKIPLRIKATGYAPGGAQTEIEAELKMYQIPIFQFGVFYEGNLEITPGPDMTVGGPVHTNSNAFFRGYGSGNVLSFKGPVTVSKSIYQWSRGGVLRYLKSPDDTSESNYYAMPGLTTDLVPATAAALAPISKAGTPNVQQGVAPLNLPIGSAEPIDLIGPRQPGDPPELTRQKFDAKINCATGCPNRFVYHPDSAPPPPWISTPNFFYDRREENWVRVWDFDVRAMSSRSNDSIFYLLDTIWTTWPSPTGEKIVLNAFRIVNGDSLPRNLTIASGNPIYIQGDFNKHQEFGPCRPAGVAAPVPVTDRYCNAMIAANTVTVLSNLWPQLSMSSPPALKNSVGTLEHTPAVPWTSAQPWASIGTPSSLERPNKVYPAGTAIHINAAILTGNKPTPQSVLPPDVAGTYADATFESVYEGGWHNTFRFLEDLSTPGGKVEMVFRGSFVCMWAANFPGLRTDSSQKVFSTNYYTPPQRRWSYDPRFANLNNMPPGTPYLATGVMASWSEPR